MKRSKTYILAVVSLAVGLSSGSALAAGKGHFNLRSSSNQSNSSFKKANRNLLQSSQTSTANNNLRTLNSKVSRRLTNGTTLTTLNPSARVNKGKGITPFTPVGPIANPTKQPRPFHPIGTVNTGKGNGPFTPIGPITNPTSPGKGTGPFNPFPGGRPPIVADPVVEPGKGTGPFNPFPGGRPPIVADPVVDPGKGTGPFNPFPGGRPPIVADPVVEPGKGTGPFNPFPGGRPPIVADPVVEPGKGTGPFNPFPGGHPPVVADPGTPPVADPGTGTPPANPPAPPADPPAPPAPPTNPCPPTCPPQCPPYNPGYCGGGWNYPPFPGGNWGGGGFGGTTTVVQPVYTPVSQPVATQTVAVEPQQAALDLELVEVRQLDRGDASQNLGPAYRVTLRNKNGAAVAQQFNVGLAASLGRMATADSAFAMVRVDGLEAGQLLTVDVRLPAKAYNLGINADGQAVPFAYLTAVADSHQELPESDRGNDYMVLGRGEIVMVAQK